MNAGWNQAFTVSYTDLSLVLLTFFIFLDAMASPDVIRRSGVLESLSDCFRRTAVSDNALKKTDQLEEKAKSAGFNTRRDADRILITIPSVDLFDSGDDRIKKTSESVLRNLAHLIAELGLSVRIEGHTDGLPIHTDRFPSNWHLSAARAVSVLRLFRDTGVPRERLSAAGRGEFVPIADNNTAEGRAKNRRVVLSVSTSKERRRLEEKP